MPASHFFEFTGKTSPKSKWKFTKTGEDWFCFAGLWRPMPDRGAAFTLLTTAPGPDVAPIHDRQMIVLEREDWAAGSISANPRPHSSSHCQPDLCRRSRCAEESCPRWNRSRPFDEGDTTGRRKPIKPSFDTLEPTIDVSKDFGGVRNECVRRSRGRPSVRGHRPRQAPLAIGGHLYPREPPRRDPPSDGDVSSTMRNAVWRRASASMALACSPHRPGPRR